MFKEPETEESIAAIDSRGGTPKSARHLWVRHGAMIRAVRKCSDQGITIGKLEMVSSYAGSDLLAAFQVRDETTVIAPGNALWFGAINANSIKRGSRYFGLVTDNEVPVVFDRFPLIKHVQGMDLRKRTERSFDLFTLRCTSYPEKAAALQARRLGSDEAEWLLYKAKLKGIIGPHMHSRMRQTFKQINKTQAKSAWTVCLAFGKTLCEFEPFPNRTNDVFTQSWKFVRMVMATKMAPMEGAL